MNQDFVDLLQAFVAHDVRILTNLTGLTFEEAWPGRVRHAFGAVQVDFIGRDSFIRNKRATGRAKDLGDIEGLE